MKKLSFKVRNNTLYIKEYKHIKKEPCNILSSM